jgi:hypothetical protein
MKKHGGCAICKSVEQEILKSITIGKNSLALCDRCVKDNK